MLVVAENSIIYSLKRKERHIDSTDPFLVFNLGAIYLVGLLLCLWFVSLISVNYLVFGSIQASFRLTSQTHAGLLTVRVHWLHMSALSALSWFLFLFLIPLMHNWHAPSRKASLEKWWKLPDCGFLTAHRCKALCVGGIIYSWYQSRIGFDFGSCQYEKWLAGLLVSLWQYMQNKGLVSKDFSVCVSCIYVTDIYQTASWMHVCNTA